MCLRRLQRCPSCKVKSITNKCQTVYFICKACVRNHATENGDGITSTYCEKDECQKQDTMTGNTNLLKSLQSMLDNKVSQIESKLEKLIDCKFGEKMDAISTLNEKLKKQSQFLATVTPEVKTYAKVLGVPTEMRQIMQEAKNDEKVEEREKERRSKKFIIRGAEEIGGSIGEIKAKDIRVHCNYS